MSRFALILSILGFVFVFLVVGTMLACPSVRSIFPRSIRCVGLVSNLEEPQTTTHSPEEPSSAQLNQVGYSTVPSAGFSAICFFTKKGEVHSP